MRSKRVTKKPGAWHVVATGNVDEVCQHLGQPEHSALITFHDNRRHVIVPFKALPRPMDLHCRDIVILGHSGTGQCIIAISGNEHDWDYLKHTRILENIRFLSEEPTSSPLPPE